jgi:selenide,water dikinase
MCENSNVSSKIKFQDLLFIDGAKELAMEGVMPGGTRRNLKSVEEVVSFGKKISEVEQLLSADAQTSGGLLISMPLEDAKSYVKEVNDRTTIIGQITKQKSYLIKVK